MSYDGINKLFIDPEGKGKGICQYFKWNDFFFAAFYIDDMLLENERVLFVCSTCTYVGAQVKCKQFIHSRPI